MSDGSGPAGGVQEEVMSDGGLKDRAQSPFERSGVVASNRSVADRKRASGMWYLDDIPDLGGNMSRPPLDGDSFSTGVFEFFSAQAEVMLAQYNNINHLLGPTSDWTHPGTLCETLFAIGLGDVSPPDSLLTRDTSSAGQCGTGRNRTRQRSIF